MPATWYIWISVSVLVPRVLLLQHVASCIGTWVHEKAMSSNWVHALRKVCQAPRCLPRYLEWKYANISGGLHAAPENLPMLLEVLSMRMEICQCTSCTWKFACGNLCGSWKLVNHPGSQSVPLKNENPCKFYVVGSLTKALEALTTPENLLMLLKVHQCFLKSANVPGTPLLPWMSGNIPGILLLPWKSANVPSSSLLSWKSAKLSLDVSGCFGSLLTSLEVACYPGSLPMHLEVRCCPGSRPTSLDNSCCPGSLPMSLEECYWPGSLPMLLEVSSGALKVCQCPWKYPGSLQITLEVYFCVWKSANDPENWYYSGSLPIFALSVTENLQIVCRWMSDKGPGIQNLKSAATTRSLLLSMKVWQCPMKVRLWPECQPVMTHLTTETRKTTGTGEKPTTNKLSFVTSRLRW